MKPNVKDIYRDILQYKYVIKEVEINFKDPIRIRENPLAVIFVKIIDPKGYKSNYIQRYL